MFNSIPASNIAAIYPATIGGGGNPLGLNATLLAKDSVYPSYEYFSENLVGQHYGLDSEIHKFAIVYFNGFDGATTRPNSLFISAYNDNDASAKLIGGNTSSITIPQLKLITGALSVVIDGVEKSGTIDLSTANTFSDAAQLIATALTIDCTYQSTTKSFLIKSETIGESSTISFADGATAASLMLTQAMGAVLSNDVVKDTAATAMKRALKFSQNFVNITYSPDTLTEDALKELATWVTQQNDRFKLYSWGLDPLALSQGDLSFGSWAKENTSGVTPIYGAFDKAAFFCGVSASVNYAEEEGRTTTMFRTQAGLVADVTDGDDAEILAANGYSFYGAWATANDRFQMAGIGAVTGKFGWIDNFDFQVFLNSQFQLSFVNMHRAKGVTAYDQTGIAKVRAYAQDPIDQGINFGGIRAGVVLSNAQKFQVNQEAGYDAASQLFTKGWALSVTLPNSQVRVARESFIINFFYTDGSSMQKLEMTSTNVQ